MNVDRRTEDPGVVITGVGVLTPLGDEREALLDALMARRRAFLPVAVPEGTAEARIADFEVGRYVAVRGLRAYNRTTQLGICACRRALDDARLGPDTYASEEVGLILASTYGHFDTLVEYDRSLLRNGLARTNPALMPLGLPSAPGAAMALAFETKAFSITIGDGGTSAIDALALAARLLGRRRAAACLVVGAFSPAREISVAAARRGILAASDDFHVFDANDHGTAFGEGAIAMVLEREDRAASRGAHVVGSIEGYASTFAWEPDQIAHATHAACDGALAGARIDAGKLGLVSASASGILARDKAEALAIAATLGEFAPETPVTAVAGSLGETFDAAGLFQTLVAMTSVRDGVVPGIAGLDEPVVTGLRFAKHPAPTRDEVHALVTSTSHSGACAALVVGGAA